MPSLPSGAPLAISVVIPCRNEERTVGDCVARALSALRAQAIAGEVVVVDNGSTDRSAEVAAAAGARVVPCETPGYGATLRAGFAAARGAAVLTGDADGSYDFGELPRFAERLAAGDRFVLGSRLRGPVVPGAMPFLHRHLGTPVLTALLNLLYGTAITDCNSGMRAMRRDDLLAMGLRCDGMELASELIARAAICGVPISEVPITLHKDRRGRAPHLRPWADGWRHLRLILWLAPDHTLSAPGLALLVAALLLALGPPGAAAGALGPALCLCLALLGSSALLLGAALRAVAPPRTLGALPIFGPLHRFLAGRGAASAAGLLGAGLGLGAAGLLGAGPRPALLGLLLGALAAQLTIAALLLGALRGALSAAAPSPSPSPIAAPGPATPPPAERAAAPAEDIA